MNEATLRRWVRGELAPGERREVSRWIVRCTDPNLGPLLHGLAIEATEERADAALSARGGPWRRLVASWRALVDAGLAELSTGAEPSLILADLGVEDAGPALRLVERDGALFAALRLREELAEAPVTLFLSDDDGRVEVLTSAEVGDERLAPLPDPLGPRATIWAVLDPVAVGDGDPALLLAAALERPERRAIALRLRDAGEDWETWPR